MSDPFSTDDAEESSGTRGKFIGRVVRSEVDTDDDRFQTEYENDIDILYEIEALNKEWKNVFELGVNVRESLNSKWMVMMGHLENIHGPLGDNGIDSLEDLCEFLTGRVYEFEEIDFTDDREFTFKHKGDGHTVNLGDLFDDNENAPNPMILPLREVTDADELAELGAEASADVEEVDF